MVGERLSHVHLSGYGLFQLGGLPPTGSAQGEVPPNSLLAVGEDVDPDGGWDVRGGRQYGPFGIQVVVLGADPGPPGAEWEDVAEASVSCAGEVAIVDLEDGPEEWLEVPAGEYRMRVCARGRSEPEPPMDEDDDLDEDLDDDLDPVEHYLVQLWADAPRPGEVLRDSDPFAGVDEEHWPDDEPPEEAAGLLAARALWRDVTDGPGARRLSGQRTTVTVVRELMLTPRRAHYWVAVSAAWPASMGSQGDSDLPVGSTFSRLASRPIAEDRRYTRDNAGEIERYILEHRPPSLVRSTWNWRVGFREAERRLVLHPPAGLTLAFDRVSRRGEPTRTRVTVTHDAVPVEWAEDLRALWAWDLAASAARAGTVALPADE